MKILDLEYENVKTLAVAPNFYYSDEMLVILIFLKKDVLICKSGIEEIIAGAMKCTGQFLRLLTTKNIWYSYEQGELNQEQYSKLLFGSLPLEAFQAETNEELNKQFNEKYQSSSDSINVKSKIQTKDLIENGEKLNSKTNQPDKK